MSVWANRAALTTGPQKIPAALWYGDSKDIRRFVARFLPRTFFPYVALRYNGTKDISKFATRFFLRTYFFLMLHYGMTDDGMKEIPRFYNSFH